MDVAISDIQKYRIKIIADFWKVISAAVLAGVIIILTVVLILKTITHPLRVSFLDVGQGDAILIQTPHGHTMLVDGGASDRILEKIAVKKNFFDRRIDVVVATHPDADHVTGLIPVLSKYNVGIIVTAPVRGETGIFSEFTKRVTAENANVRTGARGDAIIFGDGVVAHILYPSAQFRGSKKETNDASVSMVITYGDMSVLLTGDLSLKYEGELLQEVLPHKVTIYKAGHHGSNSSSGEQLLSYIQPEYAIISAGKNNKYDHPGTEATQRLATYSKEILSTIEKGTITFSLTENTIRIATDK